MFTAHLHILFVAFVVCLGNVQGTVKDDVIQGLYDADLIGPPTLDHTITDCMTVTSEEGMYFYRTPPAPKGEEPQIVNCGVYFIARPNQRIEITFRYMVMPCEEDGAVEWVDGWEMNGELFPGVLDHPLPLIDRADRFCGRVEPAKILRSSQNAALIAYKVRPGVGKGFSINVRFVLNHSPCNILASGIEPSYTLRNHGKRGNCTLSAVFPAAIRILSMAVGGPGGVETGFIHRCEKRGLQDFIEVGGSNGLDSVNLQGLGTVCGEESRAGREQVIACGVSTVRLTSSGRQDNVVTVSLTPAIDLSDSALECRP